jgi:hypothetical protein
METPPRVAAFASPLLADGVAITHFDGNGGLTQVDFVMRNGTSAATPTTPLTENGFRAKETGSYTVSEDCTGTFKIMFPDTSEIDVAFVVANHGSKSERWSPGSMSPRFLRRSFLLAPNALRLLLRKAAAAISQFRFAVMA